MQLVSIETEEEQRKLSKISPRTEFEGWWTSGSDQDTEGEWIWTATNERLNYTNWAKRQPNGEDKENYLLLKPLGLYWDDKEGQYDNEFFICEN